jgi:hypothetical protein
MKLEKQIYRLIWDYPTLYHNRTDALHHFFIVNGNGYHWSNGEMRSFDDTKKLVALDYIDNYLAIEFEKRKQEMADWPEKLQDLAHRQVQNMEAHLAERAAETREVRQQIEQRMRGKPPIKGLYPLCEYAKICNLPDNIKEDWLLGAQEALDLALAVNADELAVAYGYSMTLEQQEAEYQRNQGYLHAAQTRINELKIARGLI